FSDCACNQSEDNPRDDVYDHVASLFGGRAFALWLLLLTLAPSRFQLNESQKARRALKLKP
ncbi:MAG: hypothetical protein WCB68_14030, partial [Pyrinomonadaceae bacterium]